MTKHMTFEATLDEAKQRTFNTGLTHYVVLFEGRQQARPYAAASIFQYRKLQRVVTKAKVSIHPTAGYSVETF